MPILVDTNAAEDTIYDRLVANNPETSRQRLDVGDVHINGKNSRICVERKTWSDLAASMSDGRLHEQKRRFIETRQDNEHLFYVIEGSSRECGNGKTHGVSNAALNAWIIKTMIRDHIGVMRTNNKDDTAWVLSYIHKQVENTDSLFQNS